MTLTDFETIRRRAEDRKGRDGVEKRLLDYFGKPVSETPTDDRVLAEMSRYVFASGISRKVVETKWPGFEEAFHGFDPNLLNLQPDDYWHDLMGDRRIIRHATKIAATRANAAFVSDLGREHGSAARYLLDWPDSDQIGLLELLVQRGARLGGMTGQYFLRGIGKRNFVISGDVLACLKEAGVPITGNGSTKSERRAIQQAFNHWAQQSGLPMSHISLICALSIDSH